MDVRKIAAIALGVIAAAAVALCVSLGGRKTEQRSLFSMDTYMTLSCTGRGADKALDAACAEIKRLDSLLSAADPDSALSALNISGGGKLTGDLAALVGECFALCESTGGAFDAAVLPLTRAWGFTAGEYRVPPENELEAALSLSGSALLDYNSASGSLSMPEGAGLDLGGIAKGYAADRARDILIGHGISSACLSLGGNICVIGGREDGSAWRVGIQDPQGEGYLGVLSVKDAAVVTSGSYERRFTDEQGNEYHHILDPKTGCPARSGLVSVTVVAADGMTADGLSTACFVMGAEKSLKYRAEHGGFELVMLCEDGTLYATKGLDGSFSSEHAVVWTD